MWRVARTFSLFDTQHWGFVTEITSYIQDKLYSSPILLLFVCCCCLIEQEIWCSQSKTLIDRKDSCQQQ